MKVYKIYLTNINMGRKDKKNKKLSKKKSSSDDESSSCDEEEKMKFSSKEYKKFIDELFSPNAVSKKLKNKIVADDDSEDKSEEESEKESKKTKKFI